MKYLLLSFFLLPITANAGYYERCMEKFGDDRCEKFIERSKPKSQFETETPIQKCSTNSAGQEDCSTVNIIPANTYRKLTLRDIRPGKCFKREVSDKIIFYKVTEVRNQTIFGLSQAVRKTNLRDFGNKVHIDHFPWNGQNMNESLEIFPCAQTPTLSDLNYLIEQCNYKPGQRNRRTMWCNPRNRRVIGYPERQY